MALGCNVGGLDKTVRIIFGLVMVGVGVYLEAVVGASAWSIAAFVVSLIAVGTAFVGYCPVNALFGIDSCRDRAEI